MTKFCFLALLCWISIPRILMMSVLLLNLPTLAVAVLQDTAFQTGTAALPFRRIWAALLLFPLLMPIFGGGAEIDGSNIQFNPETLDAVQRRPYDRALQAFRDDVSRAWTFATIENEYNLQPKTFRLYKNWSDQQPDEISAPEPVGRVKRASAPEDVVESKEAASMCHFGNHNLDSVLRHANTADSLNESLRSAGLEAKKLFEEKPNSTSLWACARTVANSEHYCWKHRTILKCAQNLIEDPLYMPTHLKGGMKTCANDPKFVEHLEKTFVSRDAPVQDALLKDGIGSFIQIVHKDFYFKNDSAIQRVLPLKTIKKLKKILKLRKGAFRFVSARRFEAMGDPRNYMAFYCAAKVGFGDRPTALRFNYDDTSIFVCADSRSGHNAALGQAFTTSKAQKLMKRLHRSIGVQLKTGKGDPCTPRLVQLGILAAADGRTHVCVCKIYDRSIAPEDNLRRFQIPDPVGCCDIHILFIRGKQLGTGAVSEVSENMSHGAFTADHADERAVAEVVFRDICVPKMLDVRDEFFKKLNHVKEKGFEVHERFNQPPYEMAREGAAAGDTAHTDPVTPVASSNPTYDAIFGDDIQNQLSSRLPEFMSPTSVTSAQSLKVDEENGVDIGSGDSDSTSSSSSDSDDDKPSQRDDGGCDHLPEKWTHRSHRCELTKHGNRFCSGQRRSCGVCLVEGLQGCVYSCDACDWHAHPRCVLPPDDHDLRNQPSANLLYNIQQFERSSHNDLQYAQRVTLSVDGATGQTKALVGTPEKPGIMLTYMVPLGIDVIKSSAQCSPSQNALDCMRSFMFLKAEKLKWTWENAKPSVWMTMFIEDEKTGFKKIMKKCSASDRNTFKMALSHLESTVSKNFCLQYCKSGWDCAGLVDLNFHTIMSHWIGFEELTGEQVKGITDLVPAFLHEMRTTFKLSDASMAAMQPFFPVCFKHYPTDRSLLTDSRNRATLMSSFHACHREAAARNESDDPGQAATGPELRPEDPVSDGKGKFLCGCCGGQFRGKHYENTDDGWARHIKLPSHIKWRQHQQGVSMAEVAQPQLAAVEMEWFQSENCSTLKRICSTLQLNHATGRRWVLAKLTDDDLPWLLKLSDRRWLEMYGLAAGQVFLLKNMMTEDARLPTTPPRPHFERQIAPPAPLLSDGIIEMAEEIRPQHVNLDLRGRVICPCSSKPFHGHHYENTDTGWNDHIKSRSHTNWRRSENGLPPLELSSEEVQAQQTAQKHRSKRSRL